MAENVRAPRVEARGRPGHPAAAGLPRGRSTLARAAAPLPVPNFQLHPVCSAGRLRVSVCVVCVCWWGDGACLRTPPL